MSRALPPRRLGFRVHAPLDLAGWHPLAIGRHLPLTTVTACPADGAALRTLCTFVANDGLRLRVGTCPACGHITYIDRPGEPWFAEFYRDTWDRADGRSVAQDIERRRDKLARLDLGVERPAVRLARNLPLDRHRPVCEIGCGYGSSLQQLARAGFTRLIGVEASQHRAEVVRGVIGAEVFTSAFEAPGTRAALAERAPFSLIYSIHALEHTYDPDAVIAAAAALQERGDYLVISVPHQEDEPSVGVLFFLPHLQAFTRHSLVALAQRHGYRVVEHLSSDAVDLDIVFQKDDVPKHAVATDPPTFDRTIAKFVRGLALKQGGRGRRRLWWLKRADRAGQARWSGVAALEAWRWERLKGRYPADAPRAMLVSGLASRHTDAADSPLEIQFADEITLYYK